MESIFIMSSGLTELGDKQKVERRDSEQSSCLASDQNEPNAERRVKGERIDVDASEKDGASSEEEDELSTCTVLQQYPSAEDPNESPGKSEPQILDAERLGENSSDIIDVAERISSESDELIELINLKEDNDKLIKRQVETNDNQDDEMFATAGRAIRYSSHDEAEEMQPREREGCSLARQLTISHPLNHHQLSAQTSGSTCSMLSPPPPPMTNHPTAGVQLQQQQEERPKFRGFGDAPPKLTFASKRMKEYFESFRAGRQTGSGGERRNLYQFFKATRTELVACLLFTLITSQALIVLRGQLQQSAPTSTSTGRLLNLLPAEATRQIGSTGSQVHATAASVNLAHGLASAFTVATLTQVFGHISGCHLIPSVSIALFVKGHISRLRLTSYLGAQLAGSALGVGLLSLLSSSQLTPAEYRQLILHQSAPDFRSHIPAASSTINFSGDRRRRRRRQVEEQKLNPAADFRQDATSGSASSSSQGSETILMSIMEQQREQKRIGSGRAGGSSNFELEGSRANDSFELQKTIKERDFGSTSLGQKQVNSIFSQQPEVQVSLAPEASQFSAVHQSSIVGAAGESRGPELARLWPQAQTTETATTTTMTASSSTARVPEISTSSSVSTASYATQTVQPAAVAETSSWIHPKWSKDGAEGQMEATTNDWSRASWSPEASMVEPRPTSGGKQLNSTLEHPTFKSLIGLNLAQTSGESQNLNQNQTAEGGKQRTRLRRRKRNRQQQPKSQVTDSNSEGGNFTMEAASSNSSSGNSNSDTRGYINLLELALPEEIMSSETIRQCIDKQMALTNGSSYLFNLRSFGHCLSLSNSSQMFVFQFLATLLVVLTYLVNVDPRRVDSGFKSLSIGLSYFVATFLTTQSGGFFANPFQLVCLSWMSTTSEWRTEWFIYLVTPMISGLFGALSHEYIDFSSLRNRSKQLHLRRSFYSLDQLAGDSHPGPTTDEGCLVAQQRGSGDNQLMPAASTVVEISSGFNQQKQRKARRSSNSSSSASSSGGGGQSGSMLSLRSQLNSDQATQSEGGEQVRQQTETNMAPLATAASSELLATTSSSVSGSSAPEVGDRERTYGNYQAQLGESYGANRKLISHSRQLRLEQQRSGAQRSRQQQPNGVHGRADHNHQLSNGSTGCHKISSLRCSDFDSNFLISSSSATSTSCSSPPTASSRRQLQPSTQTTHHTSGWM